MPHSSSEGKGWLAGRIAQLEPVLILDVGVGAGAYARMLRAILPNSWYMGVEIWEPYVQRFALRDLYNHLIIGDARTVDLPPADVVILGDVIEHIPADDAVALWARCRAVARRGVFLSLPIVHWPQGPEEGNPHEEHVAHWSHPEVLDRFDGIGEHRVGQQIGVYEALTR